MHSILLKGYMCIACDISHTQISSAESQIQLWSCSQRNGSQSHFGTWFGPFPDLKAWFYPLWTQSYFKSGFWNALFKTRQKGHFGDPPRKPDSEDMWTQSSFGTWFVRANFGNARWSHAWVNLCSRNKILPRSARILFVIGTAFAMLVNARSSNHEPNQEADRDLKRLSERDSTVNRSFVNKPTVPLRTIRAMHDGCTQSMVIAPFWFSMEHR